MKRAKNEKLKQNYCNKILKYLNDKYNRVFKDKYFTNDKLKAEINKLLGNQDFQKFDYETNLKKIEKIILNKVSKVGKVKYEPIQMSKINDLINIDKLLYVVEPEKPDTTPTSVNLPQNIDTKNEKIITPVMQTKNEPSISSMPIMQNYFMPQGQNNFYVEINSNGINKLSEKMQKLKLKEQDEWAIKAKMEHEKFLQEQENYKKTIHDKQMKQREILENQIKEKKERDNKNQQERKMNTVTPLIMEQERPKQREIINNNYNNFNYNNNNQNNNFVNNNLNNNISNNNIYFDKSSNFIIPDNYNNNNISITNSNYSKINNMSNNILQPQRLSNNYNNFMIQNQQLQINDISNKQIYNNIPQPQLILNNIYQNPSSEYNYSNQNNQFQNQISQQTQNGLFNNYIMNESQKQIQSINNYRMTNRNQYSDYDFQKSSGGNINVYYDQIRQKKKELKDKYKQIEQENFLAAQKKKQEKELMKEKEKQLKLQMEGPPEFSDLIMRENKLRQKNLIDQININNNSVNNNENMLKENKKKMMENFKSILDDQINEKKKIQEEKMLMDTNKKMWDINQQFIQDVKNIQNKYENGMGQARMNIQRFENEEDYE